MSEMATLHEMKMIEMGRAATALLQLHLKDPKKFDAFEITDRLFNKFEELGLEEDIDGE